MANFGKFTQLALESKIAAINDILDYLDDNEIKHREVFLDLLQVVFATFVNLDQRTLSDDMGFSYGRVRSWARGQSAPHPVLFETIVNWVKKALFAKRKELRLMLAV